MLRPSTRADGRSGGSLTDSSVQLPGLATTKAKQTAASNYPRPLDHMDRVAPFSPSVGAVRIEKQSGRGAVGHARRGHLGISTLVDCHRGSCELARSI